jgi:FkbM family methyltransferase
MFLHLDSAIASLAKTVIPDQFRRAIAADPWVQKLFSSDCLGGDHFFHFPEGNLLGDSFLHRFLGKFSTLSEFEPELTAALAEKIESGSTVVDIGANIGIHSRLMSRLCGSLGRVIAFEPDPRNIKYLVANTVGCDNVTVVGAAVGAKEDIQRITFVRDGFMAQAAGDSRAPSWRHLGPKIQVTTIDGYFESHSDIPAPEVIKIDVEGAEARVLEGMNRTLEVFHPTIICELHPQIDPNCSTVPATLSRFGYDVRMLDLDSASPKHLLATYQR